MNDAKLYDYQGRKVEGEEVLFTTKGEQWCVYALADGSELKVKLVMMDVVRLKGVEDNGQPVYLFTAQQVVGVTPHPSLLKPASGV